MADFAQTAWVAGGAPGINAAQLNRLEAGVKDAAQDSKQRGALNTRPPASAQTKNWFWLDAVTNALSYCDGAAWTENINGKAPSPVGTRAARPAANAGIGTYFATDIAVMYVSDGAAWYRTGEPPGTLAHWPAQAIPTGWKLMDGTVFTDNAGDEIWWDLHALAAVEFTAGRTGFFHRVGLSGAWPVDRRLKLKDVRGQTLIGSGQPLNDNGAGNLAGITSRPLGTLVGAESVVLTPAQLARHRHALLGRRDVRDAGGALWSIPVQSTGGNLNGPLGGGTIDPDTDYTGNDQAHPNMQPSVAANIIIRL